MTGNLMSKLGLDRGERCDELGQVMYIEFHIEKIMRNLPPT
jgi:hypothetical protein